MNVLNHIEIQKINSEKITGINGQRNLIDEDVHRTINNKQKVVHPIEFGKTTNGTKPMTTKMCDEAKFGGGGTSYAYG